MIQKNLMILYAWVSRSHICEIDQNPGLTGIGICFVCYQQHWESWKGFKIIILMVWWQVMKGYALLGLYSDICHPHFMPHRAINYIIERLGYFLVFHSINYHSIYYRTHHKVTQTLNKVIIARWSITCRWHMSEYTHNKAHSFMKCHQTIGMIILKPFHDSQVCW